METGRSAKPWEIREAEFVVSAARRSDYPRPPLPQVAFAGRSNVGKSALLNCLVRRRRLAKTSRTPGLTQLINFFLINGRWHFVDLPGYGYAKAPPVAQEKWRRMVEAYLTENPNLRLLVLLLDVRRVPSPLDDQLVEFLELRGIPAQAVLTKCDKLKRNALAKARREIGGRYGLSGESLPIATSAVTGAGREDLLRRIAEELERGVSAGPQSSPQ